MTLYLPIGPPGCGKSTLADALVTDGLLDREAIVCPDHYREVLTGKRAAQHENERVFLVCNTIAAARIANGLDVWFDATNLPLNPGLASVALHHGANVVCVTFDHLTVHQIEVRNELREHPVPKDVLARFFGHWANVQTSSLPGYTINAEQLRPTLKASKSQ